MFEFSLGEVRFVTGTSSSKVSSLAGAILLDTDVFSLTTDFTGDSVSEEGDVNSLIKSVDLIGIHLPCEVKS